MVSIVNIVASGRLNQYVDLDRIAETNRDLQRCDRPSSAHLNLQFETDGPVVTIHRTGRYSIRNAESVDRVESTNQTLLDLLSAALDDSVSADEPFTVDNVIWMKETNEDLDLQQVSNRLGENAVYPDRPGAAVVYRFPDRPHVAFITENGKIILSGIKERELAESTAESIRGQMA